MRRSRRYLPAVLILCDRLSPGVFIPPPVDQPPTSPTYEPPPPAPAPTPYAPISMWPTPPINSTTTTMTTD